METFVNIEPLKLEQSDIDALAKSCKNLFPTHEFHFDYDSYIVTLIKENWCNPESFKMHWFELCFTVLIPLNCDKWAVKYWSKELAGYLVSHNITAYKNQIFQLIRPKK